MYIDPDFLTLQSPDTHKGMEMCTECRVVYTSAAANSCPNCSSLSSLPFLDRRPLRLSEEAMTAIRDELDRLGDSLGTLGEEEMVFVINELGPALSGMIDDSVEAASKGSGYRETSATPDEIILLARKLCVPPTKA